MKRILIVGLMILMIFALTSCTKDSKETETESTSVSIESSIPQETEIQSLSVIDVEDIELEDSSDINN